MWRLIYWCLGLAACTSSPVSTPDPCAFPHAGPGEQHLAVLVGVGEYQSEDLDDLDGPPHDVAEMRQLLTETYEFSSNICELVDADATLGAFEAAIKKLSERADKDDQVVIYFSGHGSQLRDYTQDEPDHQDETLAFHDARNGKVCDLRDDGLYELIKSVTATKAQVTVLLDACFSGAMVRANEPVRRIDPTECGIDGEYDEKSDNLLPDDAKGLVMFAASQSDGQAFERQGRGLFTRALIKVLRSPPQRGRFTWGQAFRDVESELEELKAKQKPALTGRAASDREVFGEPAPDTPTWSVADVKEGKVKIVGTPWPGWTIGATAHVFREDSTLKERKNTELSVATARVVWANGISAVADVISQRPERGLLQTNQRVVLASPGTVEQPLGVSLSALPQPDKDAIVAELVRRPLLHPFLDVHSQTPTLSIHPTKRGYVIKNVDQFEVRTIETRTIPGRAELLADRLEKFVIQQNIMALVGNGRGTMTNDHTVELGLAEVRPRVPSCRASEMQPAALGQLQEIPLCAKWRAEVGLRADASVKELSVGGAILWNDGSMTALPSEHLTRGGHPVRFPTMMSTVPLSALEHVVVVGVPTDQEIDWAAVVTGTRGPGSASRLGEESPWTTSKLTFRTTPPRPGKGSNPVLPETVGAARCNPLTCEPPR